MTDKPMLPPSLWTTTATPAPETAPLDGERRADVAIVGAGYTGLSAALHLAQTGVDVVVLEAAEPGWGASGRNGGQVIPGLKQDPDELIAHFGRERAERIIEFAGSAADLVFALIERHGIACDAVREGWIQPAHSPKALDVIRRRAEAWQSRGVPLRMLARDEVVELVGSSVYHGGWLDPRGGGIQPLSFARGLARAAMQAGASIHGGSPAIRVERKRDGWRVQTPRGAVTAEAVVVATNGYTDRLWPRLKDTVIAANSFQVATKPLPSDVRKSILSRGHVASDTRLLLNYYRVDASGRLLMGGRGHFRDPRGPEPFRHLERAARRIFPQIGDIAFEYRWGGRVAITQDHLPHIHTPAPGLYAALGYNGRGVAMATAMGRAVAAWVRDGVEPALPTTPIKPIPLHGLQRLYVAGAVTYFQLRDLVG